MSIVLKSEHQLLYGTIDEGLPYVASYLERKLNQPIIITNKKGCIYYPEIQGIADQMDDYFIKLPQDLSLDLYFYQDLGRILYYPIENNGENIYIIVKNLPKSRVAHTVSIFKEAKLAIQCYFLTLNKTNKNKENFERELAKYLNCKSNRNIKDIIKLSEKELDLEKPYFVEIIEADKADLNEVDWQTVCSYSRVYLKQVKIDVLPIALPNCLTMIVPVFYQNDIPKLDSCYRINSTQYINILEKKFDIKTCHGIGKVYPLADLHKSYHEARLALILPRLLGKKNFIQQFSDLGIFSLIFSQDTGTIKNHCLNTLDKLIEYDKTDGMLLPTLRKLLDSNFNLRSTADSLFIHINTLYYRIDKIEKLLHVELSNAETRVNLYTAIKVWDALKNLDSID